MVLRLWRVVWGRLRTDWAFLFACWLLVATAVTLVTSGALYADTVELGGVRRALAEADPADQGVLVRLSARASEIAALDTSVRGVLARAFGETGAEIALTARSASLKPALGGEPGLDASVPVQRQLVVLGAYEGLDRHAELIDGAWPVAGRSPVEATLSEGAAAALGLRPGARLQLADAATPGANAATVVADVVIVGIWTPNGRSDAYWLGDRLDVDGIAEGSTLVRGPVMVAAADLAAIAVGGIDLRWRALPLVDRVQISRVDNLRAGIAGIPAALSAAVPDGRNVTANVKLGDVLGTIDRSVAVSRSGVVLVILQFALLAGYAVLLAGALLVERRRPEVALLRARGARPNQVGLLAVAEASALAIPAGLVAPLVALGVIGLIGRLGAVGDAGIISAPTLTTSELALTAAAGIACVLALSLPALIADIDLAHVRAALGRPLGRTLAQRIGLDLVLGVVTVIGLLQLQTYGSVLARGTNGELTIDPVLVAAPALSLAAGALLVIRIVPRLGEIADWLFRRRRGLLITLEARQIARRPLRYTRTALLIVLAAALATFAAAYSTTWAHSQSDQAAYQAGADIRVRTVAAPLLAEPDGEAALQALAGVRATTPALRDDLDVGRIVQNTSMLAIDVDQLAANLQLGASPEAGTVSAAIADLAARPQPEIAGIELPAGTRRMAVVVDLDFHPADPNFPVPDLQAGPGQGFEVRSQLALPDGRIVDLRAPLESFKATDRRVELAIGDEAPAVAGSRGPKVLQIDFDPNMPVAMVGTITVKRLEVSPTAAGDGDWAPFVDAAAVADWSFEHGGPSLTWESSGPLFPRDDFRRPPPVTWGPDSASQIVLDMVASASFIAASGSAIGDSVALTYHSATFDARIAGVVPMFPSLDPNHPFLLLDLASLKTASHTHRLSEPAANEWWLWTEPGSAEAVADALLRPPIGATELISQARLRQSLERDPIALGLVGALALGSLAAAVCAAVGLIVGAIVSTRERLTENALLRALGMSRRSVTTGVLLDNGYLLAFGLPAGLGLGALIGWLVLPHTALNSSGVTVVPTPTIVIPLDIVIALAVIGTVLLAVSAFAAGRVANSVPIADVLRSGEA